MMKSQDLQQAGRGKWRGVAWGLGHAPQGYFLRSRYLILVATTSDLYCPPSFPPLL
jgi:hypothetical protein